VTQRLFFYGLYVVHALIVGGLINRRFADSWSRAAFTILYGCLLCALLTTSQGVW
jgi:hypothetical protein